MSKKSKLPDLEHSLAEISALTEQMEDGEPSLEQSLADFERGITLIKHAQKILQAAEHRVQVLIENNNSEKLNDYGKNDE